jgi:drug/metabolite transporter (DMT)-like permease
MGEVSTWSLLIAVLVFETVSHLALKSAATLNFGRKDIHDLRRFVRQPAAWLAGACFVGGFLAWLAFLSRVPLGQGVMAGSLTIVGVMLGGWLVYGERLTLMRSVAVALISVGVALVGWGRA